jgi:hypothetical protein
VGDPPGAGAPALPRTASPRRTDPFRGTW